jgi:hypothetical protein
MNKIDYQSYIDNIGTYQSHSEDDGRTWIINDLFSRLKSADYLNAINNAGFKREFVVAVIDPRAYSCLREENIASALLNRFDKMDLIVSALSVIYRK